MLNEDDRKMLERATRNAQNFQILRSMFWEHINRANRIAILKHFFMQEEEIVPDRVGTFCQFCDTQMLESRMMRSIHNSGRSRELWDMVMEYVPDGSKIDNPF
jgi:hypothetical protein